MIDPTTVALGIGQGMLGLTLADYNDQRQLRQQEKLQAMQVKGNKELAQYNQQLALDTWNKTNYEEQRRHMERAGLSVGLMYGKGGPGGTATGGSSQSVTGGQAPTGGHEMDKIMDVLAIAQAKAQIENIKADTEKKGAEKENLGAGTAKTRTETDKLFVDMENIVANTFNTEAQTALNQTLEKIKSLELSRESQTFHQWIEKVDAELKALTAEANLKTEEAKVSAEKFRAEIDLLKVNKRAQEAGIQLTEAETQKVKTMTNLIQQDIELKRKENANFWDNWNLQERQTYVNEQMQRIAKQRADFDTSTANQIKQWTGIVTDLIPFIGTGGHRPIGFK